MIRIHVTYDEIKRIISFPKGGEVYKLRPHFILAFSDVLSGDIAPKHVTFQKFHEDFKDFTELHSDGTLDNDIKIRAITLKTLKKVSVSDYQYLISSTLPPEVKPHSIKQYVRYRFWNLVCNGLIRLDVSTGTPRVKGNGSFGNNPDAIVQAEAIGFDLFHIYFKYGELKMYITSQGEGETITAEPRPTKYSEFTPEYYWSYTLFKSMAPENENLYLGCEKNQNVTLVRMSSVHYPVPQALFIVTQDDIENKP